LIDVSFVLKKISNFKDHKKLPKRTLLTEFEMEYHLVVA